MKINEPSITLCMIVRNEAKNLEPCINSIKPQIDEIIVVDTGSKDKTIQIAKKLGAKVYNFVWDNDFSAARNFGLQQASGDWIICLDADHIFLNEERDVLKNAIKKNNFLAFTIEERHQQEQEKYISNDRIFLFKNHCGFIYEGLVYEHPMKSIRDYANNSAVNDPYGKLQNCQLNHVNHINLVEKQKRKLKILNETLKKDPDNFQHISNKLLTLKSLKRYKEFETVLLGAIFNIEKQNPELSQAIVGIWGEFGKWIQKGDNTKHIELFYNRAKKLNKKTKFNDIRLVWPYVKISILQKNYNRAIKDLTACIQNGIVPQSVAISKQEKITPVYQLLKLINDEKSLEDFAAFVLDLPQLLSKSNVLVSEVLELLKINDAELYESIKDILGQSTAEKMNHIGNEIISDKEPTISLCMVIKNEQENLDRCLSSVAGIVDEIIIVDTGSADKSVDIALNYGAQVIKSNWNNDFAEARNIALKLANGNWILQLDADEELNLSTKEKIKPALKSTRADALNIIVRSHQPEDELVRYIDVHYVRLFRNKHHYRYRYKVNEQIIPSIAESGGAFKESLIIINNWGSISKTNTRFKRAIPFYNAALKTYPKDASLLFRMGETYKSLNKLDKAEKCYIEAISNPNGNITNQIKEIIFLRLAQISLANDKYKNSKKYATACLRFNKQNAMAKYILAVTYMYLGQSEPSALLFIELKQTQKVHGLDLSDVDSYLEALDKKLDYEDKLMN